MKKLSLKELEKKAEEIREDIVKSLLIAGSGHTAGPLGMADVFTALYFNALNHNPEKPDWEERDRVVLSNGHICPVWYVTLAHAGYFPKEELKKLRKLGAMLQGHPNRLEIPGVENSSGPLGQGMSVAIGMALAAKLDGAKHEVFALLSDGEQQEGQSWEAAMFAGKHRLNNLTAIMDRNNIQIDGYTEDVMPIEPLKDKYEAFNWHVLEIDGHNLEEILDAINKAKAIYEKPVMIIANTIPGKGVEFMEDLPAWHGKPPKGDEAKKALQEIRSLKGRILTEDS